MFVGFICRFGEIFSEKRNIRIGLFVVEEEDCFGLVAIDEGISQFFEVVHSFLDICKLQNGSHIYFGRLVLFSVGILLLNNDGERGNFIIYEWLDELECSLLRLGLNFILIFIEVSLEEVDDVDGALHSSFMDIIEDFDAQFFQI